jgi:hypothetical protein
VQYSFYIGLLGVAAITLCWALAVVLFRVGPAESVARKLSVLLVIEGITLVTAGFPDFLLGIELDWYAAHPVLEMATGIIHHLGDAGMVALYPPFLAAALGTSLTRPFGVKRVRITITIVALAMAAGTVVSYVFWNSMLGSSILYFTVMLVFFFSLIASLHAWRTARPGLARRRAGLFAVAFGIRDICWLFSYAGAFWIIATDSFSPENPIFWASKGVYALGTLLAVPLIAYGILSAHLFDIDLRIKWTIKQSTLAAVFLAVMFLISEGASTFLSNELGNVVGLLAAAVLMFFLAPLQRMAERVASAAMPNTDNTPEYAAFRKMQVYEAALVDALAEGGISAKERALLGHLRDSLGITPADAEAIERELTAGPSNGALATA